MWEDKNWFIYRDKESIFHIFWSKAVDSDPLLAPRLNREGSEKFDMKDGYWRLQVVQNDAWNFAYFLPKFPLDINTDKTYIIIPSSIWMGQGESPAYFCAAL